MPDAQTIRDALACGGSCCARNNNGRVHCPAHDDRNPDLSVKDADGKVLVHCFAGCTQDAVIDALRDKGLWPSRGQGGGGAYIPPDNIANVQTGCTLAEYADAKRLPVDFLGGLGLQDIHYLGDPAIRIPYLDVDGTERAVRFRLALGKGDGADNRFRWKSGAKPCLYGLWRLAEAASTGHVVLVEGESDCHTLWHTGVPAVGIPGATNWNEERDAPHLEDIGTIYVILEPDKGGEAVLKWLARSAIRDRVRLVKLGAHKDVGDLYLSDPDAFKFRFQAALGAAMPWGAYEAAQADTERSLAWSTCAGLAYEPRILDVFGRDIIAAGVVGEERAARLLYLIFTSRLLDRPVSAAVKGPSSAGKSFLVERVLRFFPDEASYALTAMSERALAYSHEPLSHRHLVIFEAAGLRSDFASYLVRSLLSEGRVRYETVEKTANGLTPRLIERDGPTGLIVTTTSIGLHAENETRLLSIPVTDTQEQTRAVLEALAQERDDEPDTSRWHALQRWLALGERRVTIPYARALASLVPPVATRLRRDFGAVLTLIRAHALLHRAGRECDARGRILASLDDYVAVRELVADVVGEGIGATVSRNMRETIQAVKDVMADTHGVATVSGVAKKLKLDVSATSRRVRSAIQKGYLVNLEDRDRRPARLQLGDPLPDDLELLPAPDRLQVCMFASETGGIHIPPPPKEPDDRETLEL